MVVFSSTVMRKQDEHQGGNMGSNEGENCHELAAFILLLFFPLFLKPSIWYGTHNVFISHRCGKKEMMKRLNVSQSKSAPTFSLYMFK